MVFAYARVSSHSQSIDRQLQIIGEYATAKGIKIDRFFEEKQSGRNFDRPVYQSMKLALRSKDILIVSELDRFGRNMSQIKEEWHELVQRGVDIIVIENELLSTANKKDLEKTLISNIVFELLSYLSNKEYLKIKSRQAVGIVQARGRDKLKPKNERAYPGRRPLTVDMTQFNAVYRRWRIDKEITAVKAMGLLGLKKDKFYDLVRKLELQQSINKS